MLDEGDERGEAAMAEVVRFKVGFAFLGTLPESANTLCLCEHGYQ